MSHLNLRNDKSVDYQGPALTSEHILSLPIPLHNQDHTSQDHFCSVIDEFPLWNSKFHQTTMMRFSFLLWAWKGLAEVVKILAIIDDRLLDLSWVQRKSWKQSEWLWKVKHGPKYSYFSSCFCSKVMWKLKTDRDHRCPTYLVRIIHALHAVALLA